jgi:hypothetical protein
MRRLNLHYSFVVALVLCFGFASRGGAESPSPRAKPQVIYHLPRTSGYPATLHSQAKTENAFRSSDRETPPSLQPPQPSTNAPPIPAQENARKNLDAASQPAPRQEKPITRKPHSKPPPSRAFSPKPPHGGGHGHGHGNPHPGKGGKK